MDDDQFTHNHSHQNLSTFEAFGRSEKARFKMNECTLVISHI